MLGWLVLLFSVAVGVTVGMVTGSIALGVMVTLSAIALGAYFKVGTIDKNKKD
jgi:hypothetical protein